MYYLFAITNHFLGCSIIINRNVLHVLSIPCVLFIVKILYLENIHVDQLYRKKSEGKDTDPCISAEVKMVMMLVQHNIFFNLSYHLTPIIKQKFKENTATQKFSCCLTKTAGIINYLGEHYFNSIVNEKHELPFSIMHDDGNDNGL